MKEPKIFGPGLIDKNAVEQIYNCYDEGDIAVLTADAHKGYGHPIGGAVAYRDRISLSGVGFDIACGNKAVRTDMRANEVQVPAVMDEIFRRISFGVGRNNNEPLDHPVIEKIRSAEFRPQASMLQMAANQLGTVGSGNHFVDLLEDEDGFLWIAVHFGSRGFGHKTTTGFIALSKGLRFGDKANEGGMDAPPIIFDANSEIGRDYIEAISLAGEYAYAGRDIVVAKVLEILHNPAVTFEVHNHHNFAWKEEHFREEYWVVRKGCTPAFPGQQGFIGSTMADVSVIVEGIDSQSSRDGLFSTVHGAGRVMSRTAAAGKKRFMKAWKCTNRNCTGELSISNEDSNSAPVCPKCAHSMQKHRWQESISPGLVNFETVRRDVKKKGVELRGAGADEAPECYKKLEDVLKAQGDTIRVLCRLRPLGVAMAGSEVFDPYKD